MTDIAERPTRNRAQSEERLIVAASQLLGEVGPKSVSVRMIAERAGVNHGLVHHYFGGKDALLQLAMTRLVEEHAEYARERANGAPVPAPLALVDDPAYLRAIVRAVLDDEMELARIEIDKGVSVPRNTLMHLAAEAGQTEPSVELRAIAGLAMAMEMGWAALEPLIFAVTESETREQQETLRAVARKLRIEMTRTLLK
jgi:AcrR family transcriptional regulator